MGKGGQLRVKRAANRAAVIANEGKAKDASTTISRKRKAESQEEGDKEDHQPASSSHASRVVYIGHLPHGFYERELLGFFSQFGKLTRVRLSRSKKSGKAKHYAFLEFLHPEVAAVAAEAMDGYFMFSQKLEVKVMSPDKIHPELFKGATRRFKNVPWSKLERKRHDKDMTPEELARRVARSIKKDKLRQKKIKEAGIDYEYPPLEELIPSKPTRKVFASGDDDEDDE